MSIFQKWIWEPQLLRLVVVAFILFPVILVLAIYPFLDGKALFFLIFSAAGILFGVVYAAVGRRVQNLLNSVSSEEGAPVQCLIVHGALQSPGIALLRGDELCIFPIAGKSVTISLHEIQSYRESCWFNGSLLVFKRGFWFKIPGRKRLGVAVPGSYADLFRKSLVAHATSHDQ